MSKGGATQCLVLSKCSGDHPNMALLIVLLSASTLSMIKISLSLLSQLSRSTDTWSQKHPQKYFRFFPSNSKNKLNTYSYPALRIGITKSRPLIRSEFLPSPKMTYGFNGFLTFPKYKISLLPLNSTKSQNITRIHLLSITFPGNISSKIDCLLKKKIPGDIGRSIGYLHKLFYPN